jgi:hypothetical protein
MSTDHIDGEDENYNTEGGEDPGSQTADSINSESEQALDAPVGEEEADEGGGPERTSNVHAAEDQQEDQLHGVGDDNSDSLSVASRPCSRSSSVTFHEDVTERTFVREVMDQEALDVFNQDAARRVGRRTSAATLLSQATAGRKRRPDGGMDIQEDVHGADGETGSRRVKSKRL